ncbi:MULTISPECIES: hypothetical protein [unclassified Mycobacterium]|uniref:hypothetical protein n=1 Tax=unclassified Mycobacterium TaxID=2642494 RepID=UPI0029C6788B|nr:MULTISPECIES: hypothetical protein [unclassified Mycobacterium]
MASTLALRSVFVPLSALVFAALGATGSTAISTADPLPYGPDTCIQGFVWRDGRPGDHVCVTPSVRSRTAQENGAAAQNKEPNGGPYGPDTCKQGFVWRDAWDGDHVCVTPNIRSDAAADNAAAESRKQANQAPPPPPPPKLGPGVSWDPRVGGLTAHINDRSGVASQCRYQSDFYDRSFFLPANGTYDLVIVPAIPKFQNWSVTISCDNGTKTETSTFF